MTQTEVIAKHSLYLSIMQLNCCSKASVPFVHVPTLTAFESFGASPPSRLPDNAVRSYCPEAPTGDFPVPRPAMQERDLSRSTCVQKTAQKTKHEVMNCQTNEPQTN